MKVPFPGAAVKIPAALRFAALLALAGGLLSCASRSPASGAADPGDNLPFDQRLARLAALNNARQYDAMASHFTKDALVQSPVTPRGANVTQFLRAAAADPFDLAFSQTENVYSFPERATTRSDATVSAPGKFNLKERVTVDWRREDGYWRIARLIFADWPAILGTWRRGGLRDDGSLELRILPGGTYVVYLAENYAAPEYRGRYTLEGNKITFVDTSANDPKNFQSGEGSYLFIRTPTGVTFRKVDEQNTWRAERYEGAWAAR